MSAHTAKHESGHVICNLALGRPFEFVELVEPESLCAADLDGQQDTTVSGFVGGRVHYDDEPVADFNRAIILMGGVAGERINQRVRTLTFIDILRSAELDYEQAKKICSEAEIDVALRRAHAIVQRHRAAHEAIASALLERGRLSYEGCVEMWRLKSQPQSISEQATDMYLPQDRRKQ